MRSRILNAIALLCCAGVSAAAAPVLDREKLAQEVGVLFAGKAVDNTTPGCAVGVIEAGQWALRKSYGMSNLEHGIPITSQSIFRMGSLSKQFTAAAIALLAEQGKVDLDADIHNYLPDLVEYGHKVTIRQMIHHLSGIPDYEEGLPALKTADGKDLRLDNQDYLSIPEFYERAKTIPLFAPPETEFAYSNTAYFLLSQIVEAASGQSLRAYAAANIFARLGMDDSFFNDEVNDVVKNRVDGYTRRDDGSYAIYMTNLSWVGDGGVYTSLDDWLKWDQNFYHNVLGNSGDAFVSQMEQTFSVSGEYAWGQSVGTYRGLKQVSHTGSWVGFTTSYFRFPERKVSIVALCNSNVITAGVGGAIRDLVLDQLDADAISIRSVRKSSNQAIARHDVDAIVSFLDEEYVITISSGEIMYGREPQAESWAQHFVEFSDVVYVRTPSEVTISDSQPLAIENGTWVGTMTTPNGALEKGGQYTAAWSKVDGVWKIRSELFVVLYEKSLKKPIK